MQYDLTPDDDATMKCREEFEDDGCNVDAACFVFNSLRTRVYAA
jgi:hypothetical protein